eukprot:gene15174-16733_t
MNQSMMANNSNFSQGGVKDNILGGTLFAINICIVFLNALALMVIMRFRSKNCIDVLVLGLALTDLTKGLIPVPMSVCIYLSSWHLRENSAACEFFGWIAFTTNSASMLILTMMAIERFVAIAKPFSYRSVITKKRMKLTVLVAVLFSAFLSALPVFGFGEMRPYNDGAYCHFDYNSKKLTSRIYSIFILVYGFTLTIIVMIAYSIVFYKIRDLIKRHRRFSHMLALAKVSVTDGKRKKDINLKVEKMFSYLTVGLMFLFWFSWLPFLIVIFASQTGMKTPHQKVDLFAIRVAVVNAMLNPLACASFCKPYRRGFFYYYKKLLSYAGFARPSSDVFDPWRQRSQMVTCDQAAGDSNAAPQNDSRCTRTRQFQDDVDSELASESLPGSGCLEPTHNVEDANEEAELRHLQHFIPPMEDSKEANMEEENAEMNFKDALHEYEAMFMRRISEDMMRRSAKENAKFKRYSIPNFYHCKNVQNGENGAKPRRPSLSIDEKVKLKPRRWSFGLKTDLHQAIYKNDQREGSQIKLLAYKRKMSIEGDDKPNETYSKDSSCDNENLSNETNDGSKKVNKSNNDHKDVNQPLLQAETFNKYDEKDIESEREFSLAARYKQQIFGRKRSHSSPTDYNPNIHSNLTYLSVQEDVYDSLKQIDILAKNLLLFSDPTESNDGDSISN